MTMVNMADPTVVCFGNEWSKGDLRDVFRNLQMHSKDVNHPLLARFIAEATRALRLEIADLPSEVQLQIPPFDSVIQWPEMTPFREGPLCGAVEGVLLIVAQVGAYIGYVERHSRALQDFATMSAAGLGIGLLASTVAALSAQPNQMPLIGADAVALAFRMGVLVHEVSDNLDATDPSADPETWAFVVHDVDATAAQAELNAAQPSDAVAETSKIFISAYSPTSITVSGPPTRLKAIFHTIPFFRDATSIPLPVYGGLCHAPHVYDDHHVNRILAAQNRPLYALAEELRPVMSLYSTSTGTTYAAETAGDLFSSVLRELLTRPISWHLVVEAIQRTSVGSQSFTLCSFGNSMPFNELLTSLKTARPDGDVTFSNLSEWIDSAGPVKSQPAGRAQDKLAIVGMSCRMPNGATSTEKFWNLLEEGLDVSRKIPEDRFDIDVHYDPTGKQLNKTQTQYGCFIDEPGLFDAPFFNMSPREAQVTDPQMRLALVTAYEALERAGYVGNRTSSTKPERIGTYYGQAADDYREVNQGQEVSTYYIPGGCRAFGPGRINYFFKFAGPSYSIDTACSSGLAAIEVACQALWAGDVDTAVAGGVNILTNPDGFSGLCNGHFLSKGHNACKTWDATADGYCRADAVGTVVIKRLEDAEADNDNILGVVLGAGTNHSANAISITHPHAGHQAYLARQTLSKACLDPRDVSYVELHGTGTQAGDHHEMEGILNVYAPLSGRRSKDQPLHIGAVKANVGHSESAAGTTALLKVLLMLQKNAIPKHIGIRTDINPQFPDLLQRNVHIPFATTPWLPRPGQKRRVAINNFGAAGGNTTMLLEEAPERGGIQPDVRQTHVISVTAKTKVSLKGNIDRLLDYIEKQGDVDMASLSYTTTARRYQHIYRIAIASSSISHLRKQLGAASQNVDLVQPIGKSGAPSIAFAFTGQGAATKSMDLELYRDAPLFRRYIHHLDSLTRAQGFPSFISALDGSHPSDFQHSPTVTQLALVCLQIALAKYWASLGIKPDVVIGHSLGEYAAMHVAGVTSISDTISLVGRRAQMLERSCEIGSHAMMAVRAPLDQIRENSENKAFTVACMNGPTDTVLAGTTQQMDEVAIPLQAAGYRCIKLDVAFAFHSEQTDPILDDFEHVAKRVTFHDPRVPFISPLLEKVIFDNRKFNANYLRRATRETVNFLGAMTNAKDIGIVDESTVWMELGPHPVCTSFVKSTLPSTRVAASSMRRGESNWKSIAESLSALHLAGVGINWQEFHRPFEGGLRLLDLPTYAFNEKNHWLNYNGDWCLTKGNSFYQTTTAKAAPNSATPATHEIQTSTVQQVAEETFHGYCGTIVVVSDLMQPDFLAAAHGHRMNNCGVVTSSIHADIAFTLGAYLRRKLLPKDRSCGMNVSNLIVTKGLIARKDTSSPQLIRITAHTDDIKSHVAELTWQTIDDDGNLSEAFATAKVLYESPKQWLSSWAPLAHLVRGRIADLDLLVLQGKANRFSRNMAYALFASNLVDYADKYRGMQSVVVHGLEAYAEVELTSTESGRWTVPPYFIDSVAHLAGFVMNCSDAMDTKMNYCVTPGWQSMCFAEPLLVGHRYKSYVKMIPTKDNPSIYLGDVYIMREGSDQEIIGMVGGIQFRSYPRILLDRFFSPPDQKATNDQSAGQSVQTSVSSSDSGQTPSETSDDESAAKSLEEPLPMNMPSTTPGPVKPKVMPVAPTGDKQKPKEDAPASNQSTSTKAILLVANEAGLDPEDLHDDASFADLGVDSLMSLVISEKLRTQIGVKVGGSLFLDYPTIGEMRTWLDEAYG